MKRNLIELIVATTDFTQAKLAKELKVSSAQISKWKAGERIPYERSQQLCQLTGFFDPDPVWIELAGTEENADAWCEYIRFMNRHPLRNGEFVSADLADATDNYTSKILIMFTDLGLKIPKKALPTKDFEDLSASQVKALGSKAEEFDSLMFTYISNLATLHCWIDKFFLAGYSDFDNEVLDINFQLSEIAIYIALQSFSDVQVRPTSISITKLQDVIKRNRNKARHLIHEFCSTLQQNNIQIKTDYFNFINLTAEELEDYLYDDEMNGIEDYYSIGEKEAISQGVNNRAMLDMINSKLDKLIKELK